MCFCVTTSATTKPMQARIKMIVTNVFIALQHCATCLIWQVSPLFLLYFGAGTALLVAALVLDKASTAALNSGSVTLTLSVFFNFCK